VIASLLNEEDPLVLRWSAVREVLRRAADPELCQAPLGRHAMDGDRVYFTLSEYDTKEPSASLPETHRNYCDVQVVLSGEEWIGWAPLNELVVPRGAYDPEKDLQLHAPSDGLTWLVAKPGRFFLFAPSDVHQPGILAGAPAKVRKMVGKVHRTLLGL
jgi:YhcH/YjgK/YiaL family protein